MCIEAYYAKLKTIWQELVEFRPVHLCTCGNLKSLIENLNYEYVMIFLMGLINSYATVRAQILLMDPIPPNGILLNCTRGAPTLSWTSNFLY